MEKSNGNNIVISRQMFVVILFAAVFLGIGIYHLISNRPKEILYVSQEEIVELEHDRVLKDKYEKRELFFGHKEVAPLAIKIANNFKSKDRYVVFSQGKVYGDDVRSISEDVHSKIIEALEESK